MIKTNGLYYIFTKDKGVSGTGCSDIIQESSTQVIAKLSSWTTLDTYIGRDADTTAMEQPTGFRSNPGDVNGEKFYLSVDEYTGRGYIPLETTEYQGQIGKFQTPTGYQQVHAMGPHYLSLRPSSPLSKMRQQ